MSFLNVFGGWRNDTEAPASVLAEWNKYSGGDLESGAAPSAGNARGPKLSVGDTWWPVQSHTEGAPVPAAPSFRIPTGTDLVYFSAILAASIICYILAFLLFLPMLIISPSKFALSFTFGSICAVASMNMLTGWQAGMKHMLSAERLPFTSIFASSMLATVYSAAVMHSYLLSIVFSGAQMLALLYYVVSYFPGGTQGLQFVMSMAWRSLTSCFGSAVQR